MLIDKGNTGDPVTRRESSITLYIVLATGEVPHEITPVHIIDLVAEHEPHILQKGGFLRLVGDPSPSFIAEDMIAEAGVVGVGMHPWEEHCVGIFIAA